MIIGVNRTAAVLLLVLFCSAKDLRPQAPATPGAEPGLTLLDAVKSTLSNHPQLKSQAAQVQISRGLREQASSVFDLVTQSGLKQDKIVSPLTDSQVTQDAQSGFPVTGQTSYLTHYTLSFSRLLRNGITVTPSFDVGRSTDNLFNASGLNASTMSLLIDVPLMRGRGQKVVAAQEHAALAEVDASLFDLNQLMSQLIASTASDYWNLAAARKNLAIAADAEGRGKIYVDNVQALVEADHAPRNDMNEVVANLAQRTSTRIAAEQSVISAQAQLAFDMGQSASGVLQDLPELADSFPDGEDQPLPSNTYPSLQFYLDEALQRRADYLAAERRGAEAGMLLNAAKNQLLPQVNLSLNEGYSGLSEGRHFNNFFVAPFNKIQGANTSIGVTYSFAGANQAAKGAFHQADATSKQAHLRQDDLARNISSQVVTSVQGVRNAILQVKKAREAVEAFQAALSGEREKYRGGIGSIVDVLTVEDKLNSALLQQVQAQQAYALALTQFRFATGTLLPAPGNTSQQIDANTFTTLPFMRAPQEKP